MCGIAGWIGDSGHPYQVSEDALAMAEVLQHRGPDAHGIKVLPSATLVHLRLSIIDLSETGAQPMSNEDGTIWTVFNGEIYNHHAIRAELESKGHTFRGRSDTEIIPHLYEEIGSAFVERLRGMFTVALYDTHKQKLILARDWFGIKPLFYTCSDSKLAFASEIAALLKLRGVDTRPNRQAIYDYAALFYIPAPQTFFAGIQALQPGEMLEADMDKGQVTWKTRFYHFWEIAPDLALTHDAATNQTEQLLRNAVAQQLESDVPLGSLLSGGIDSSLVSAYAQDALSEKLLTFNVRFADEEYDETWAALAVAKHVASHHQTLDMDSTPGDWDYITGLLCHAGQPFADTSLFAVNIVCKLMRQHVTVALSGDGGDEGFGGYDFYQRAPVLLQLDTIPAPIRRFGLRTGATVIGAILKGARRNLSYRMRELAEAGDATGLVQTLFVWIREQEHGALCRDMSLLPVRRHFERQWKHRFPAKASSVERISAHMTEVNTRLVLPNDFLFKVDIASMNNSLEVRVPMLDEDLFTFGISLPHSLKTQAKKGKVVLRSVARRRLPLEVVEKPKWGFGIPVDKWVNNDFKDKLSQTLLGPGSKLPEYFNPHVYKPYVEAFAEGRLIPGMTRMGLYQRAMMLLSLELALSR
jgi:asparagine synthase (glutamine-hydrolysing)